MMAVDRPGGAPAARYRPRQLGRRRSGRLARALSHRIAHVHTKDVRASTSRARRKRRTGRSCNRCWPASTRCPGDGAVDYVSVFKGLPDYSGWVVIEAEQDPVKAPPAQYVKMGYDNLLRFIAEAGWKY